MPFKLNVNPGAKDTLHREHPFEECNVDDAKDVKVVDDETAAALISMGAVRFCEHCDPLADKV